MPRLFTFGCSFTQYWRWPTWANILGREYSQFENWGICGSGNAGIFYNVMECHQRRTITADDTVMIMWSNTSREDRYVGNRWIEGGNVYWGGNGLPEDYIRQFACERGYLIRDLACISATQKLLDAIGCQWEMMSIVPLAKTNKDTDLGYNPGDNTDIQDVTALYQDVLEQIQPSVFETVFHGNWNSRPGIPDANDSRRRDFHPTPIEHLEYLDQVFPGLIKQSTTRDWVVEQQQNYTTWRNADLPKDRL